MTTPTDELARAVTFQILQPLSLLPYGTSARVETLIAAAIREAEGRVWEKAAELAQVADLVEPDGHTPIEKLKIWVILGKFTTLCRAQAVEWPRMSSGDLSAK